MTFVPARSPGRRAAALQMTAAWLGIALASGVAPGATGCAQSAPPPAQSVAAAAPAPGGAARPAPAAPLAQAPSGAPLRLFPAAEARPLLLASITMPSFDRTLSGALALLSRAVPLPLDAAGVKEALLTQAGLPPKVGENLDTATPAGAVVIATGSKEVGGLVMAIPAKGVEQARVVINALGSVVGRRGEIMQIDNGSGGRGWVWQSANVIVLSDSVDALGRGAMLALDARRAGTGDDLTAVIYPEAIARANGTNLKAAVTTLVALARIARASQLLEAEKARKPDPKSRTANPGAKPSAISGAASPAPGDAIDDYALAVLEDLAGYVGDINTVEIGVSMDDGRGLIATARVHPLPGTPFEKLTAEGRPFTIDPALLRRSDEVAFVGASSYGPFLHAQIDRQRKRIADSHDKGAPAALAFLDAVMASIDGSWSGSGRLQPVPALQLVYPLKDATSALKLSAAMARLEPAAALAFWKSLLPADQRKLVDWKLKKEAVGKLKAFHYTVIFDLKKLPAATRDAVKKLLGAATLDVYSGISGTRMLITAGKDARAKLVELGRDVGGGGAAAASKATGGAAPAKSVAASAPGAAVATTEGAPRATPADGDGSALIAGPNGDLTDAVVAARGKDSFVYLDVGQVLGLIGSLFDEPRAKGLAAGLGAPIPTYFTFANDSPAKQMTFAWTLTPAAFAGAGAILQAFSSGRLVK